MEERREGSHSRNSRKVFYLSVLFPRIVEDILSPRNKCRMLNLLRPFLLMFASFRFTSSQDTMVTVPIFKGVPLHALVGDTVLAGSPPINDGNSLLFTKGMNSYDTASRNHLFNLCAKSTFADSCYLPVAVLLWLKYSRWEPGVTTTTTTKRHLQMRLTLKISQQDSN